MKRECDNQPGSILIENQSDGLTQAWVIQEQGSGSLPQSWGFRERGLEGCVQRLGGTRILDCSSGAQNLTEFSAIKAKKRSLICSQWSNIKDDFLCLGPPQHISVFKVHCL
jgi:hypothetical protein